MKTYSSVLIELHELVQSNRVLTTMNDLYCIIPGDKQNPFKIVVKPYMDEVDISMWHDFHLLATFKGKSKTFQYICNESFEYKNLDFNITEEDSFQQSLLDIDMLTYDEVKLTNDILKNVLAVYRGNA